jgi:hypothetical protein
MPRQLFLFVQMEFPWDLGPPDGRYLMRAEQGGDPERVIVLNTLSAPQRAPKRTRISRSKVNREPAEVPTTRVTVIDPVPVASETQAHAWLSDMDVEREIETAAAVLDRVLFAHRIASADPHLHEVSPAQALVIRSGFGEGEQVADAQWSDARELILGSGRKQRRATALRPQERLAVLIGARGQALICEELTLRCRLDLDRGRLAHAALGLEPAYTAALAELDAEQRADLAPRIEEMRGLYPEVAQASSATLHPLNAEPSEEIVRHALGRLEAALRARTATGFADS